MIPAMWQRDGAPKLLSGPTTELGFATPTEGYHVALVQKAVAAAAIGSNPTDAALEKLWPPHKPPTTDAEAYLWAAYQMAKAAAAAKSRSLLTSAQSALAKSAATYAIPGTSLLKSNVQSIMQSAQSAQDRAKAGQGLWPLIKGVFTGDRPDNYGVADWFMVKWALRSVLAAGGAGLVWYAVKRARKPKAAVASNGSGLGALFRRKFNEPKSPDADVETDGDDDDGEE